jgi:glycerol-3-phosphate dehydrogenase
VTRIGQQQLGQLEPDVRGVAGLLCAATGIIDPAELVQSLRAAAESRGAVTVLRAEVTGIESEPGGFRLTTSRGPVRAARLVNAAGLESDRIARLVGHDQHTIYPCRGDYFRLCTPTVYRHLVYPVKDPAHPGLGIHLTLDRGGGYRLGPDAEYVQARDDFREAAHKRALFHAAAERLLGPLSPEQLRYDSCGIRPKLRSPADAEERDFVLEERPSGFVHLIGIESPGLTSALALAERVATLLR